MSIVLNYAKNTIEGQELQLAVPALTVNDKIINLNGAAAPTSDDGKDIGIEFQWHNGTTAKKGFFGFKRSTQQFVFIPDCAETNEVISGEIGWVNTTSTNSDKLDGQDSSYYLSSSNHIYVNTTSGLTSDTVQEAIDEIVSNVYVVGTTLSVEEGIKITPTVISSSTYTILNADTLIIYNGNVDCTLTLPAADRQLFYIKNRSNNTVTLVPTGNSTIDGNNQFSITYSNSAITIVAVNNDWCIF